MSVADSVSSAFCVYVAESNGADGCVVAPCAGDGTAGAVDCATLLADGCCTAAAVFLLEFAVPCAGFDTVRCVVDCAVLFVGC